MTLPGSCRQCGECCKHLVLNVSRDAPIWANNGRLVTWLPSAKDDREFYEARGAKLGEGSRFEIHYDTAEKQPVYLALFRGAPMLHVRTSCRQLTEAGKCSIYDKPERPLSCKLWPMSQDDLEPVAEVCGYGRRKD